MCTEYLITKIVAGDLNQETKVVDYVDKPPSGIIRDYANLQFGHLWIQQAKKESAADFQMISIYGWATSAHHNALDIQHWATKKRHYLPRNHELPNTEASDIFALGYTLL